MLLFHHPPKTKKSEIVQIFQTDYIFCNHYNIVPFDIQWMDLIIVKVIPQIESNTKVYFCPM